ncbi:unnamed protein product [Heterobilharzia americana]|nr:unnamed protein product [Heterobilharzia americana]
MIDAYYAKTEIQRKIDQMFSVRRGKLQNILQLLSLREASTSLSSSALRNWPHCFLQNKKCREVIPVGGQISNALVYPDNNSLYAISSNSLQTFTFKWITCESLVKNLQKFVLSEVNAIFPRQLGSLRFLDFRWRTPGKELALLTENTSGGALITLEVSDETHTMTSQLTIPFNPSLFRFTSPYLIPEGEHNLYSSRSVTVLTRKEVFISNYNYHTPLCVLNSDSHLPKRNRKKLLFTACCEASLWKSYDPETKCIESVNGRQSLMYVAGVSGEKGFLSLVEPSLTPHKKNIQLINFHTGYWTTLAQCVATNVHLEISSLQCLGTHSGDRLGLIVSRRCGLIELWDERFPNKPVIEYYGSDGSNLMSVASHIPPFPVVDPVLQTTIACSLLPNHHIGIWDIHTGNVIDVYELPQHSCRPVSCPPPFLIHRTSWSSRNDGETHNTPSCLLLDGNYIQCFE